jgi:hypothetical protein
MSQTQAHQRSRSHQNNAEKREAGLRESGSSNGANNYASRVEVEGK